MRISTPTLGNIQNPKTTETVSFYYMETDGNIVQDINNSTQYTSGHKNCNTFCLGTYKSDMK